MPKKYQIYAAGNALVDVLVQVEDSFLNRHQVKKGVMTLTEQDKQAQLLAHFAPNKRLQRSGGSAANTLVAFAQLGGRCFYACQVGDDELGYFYLNDLREAGVHTVAERALQVDGRTGTCFVMVTPDGERSMHTYLGATATFSVDQLDEEVLCSAEWLYMEGYLLTAEKGQKALLKAKEIAHTAGVRTALTLSDPFVVQQHKAHVQALLKGGVDMLFCNKEEAQILTGAETIPDICDSLQSVATRYAVTQGAAGAVLYDGKNLHHVPAVPTQVVDTNGAGDMFAGVFLRSMLQGQPFADAGHQACRAAAKLVAQLGPRLQSEQLHALIR